MRADREAARGAALMALPTGVQPTAPAAPPSPQSVSVSGQAQVDQTLHLDISLDPALRATLDQITSSLGFAVPALCADRAHGYGRRATARHRGDVMANAYRARAGPRRADAPVQTEA